jgi:hypothetical protein
VLVVGDVVGHGLQAARRASFIRTTFAATAPFSDDPGQLLSWANTALTERAGTSVEFVTAACVTFLPSAQLLRWAYAGHPPALWLDGGQELTAPRQGTALGLGADLGCAEGSRRSTGGAGRRLRLRHAHRRSLPARRPHHLTRLPPRVRERRADLDPPLIREEEWAWGAASSLRRPPGAVGARAAPASRRGRRISRRRWGELQRDHGRDAEPIGVAAKSTSEPRGMSRRGWGIRQTTGRGPGLVRQPRLKAVADRWAKELLRGAPNGRDVEPDVRSAGADAPTRRQGVHDR